MDDVDRIVEMPLQRKERNEYTTEEFLRMMLKLSKAGNWYLFNGIVNGRCVEVKGYNNYLKHFYVNGVNEAMPLQLDEEKWLQELKEKLS